MLEARNISKSYQSGAEDLPVLSDVNIALALTLPMGVTEAAASLCIGRLIDKQMPPRFILGFTNLLQMCITLVFPYLLRQTFLLILSPFRSTDLSGGAGTPTLRRPMRGLSSSFPRFITTSTSMAILGT